MKEQKIEAFIGMYGCIILSTLNEGGIFQWLWLAGAIYWAIRYIYLSLKQQINKHYIKTKQDD